MQAHSVAAGQEAPAPTLIFRETSPRNLGAFFDRAEHSDLRVSLLVPVGAGDPATSDPKTTSTRVINLHQVVLAAHSPRLRALLAHGAYANSELSLAGADPGALYAALRFIYTGECELLSAVHAVHVYDAANKLELTTLAQGALQYLAQALQPGSVTQALEEATGTGQATVVEALLTFINARLPEVLASPAFTAIKDRTLAQLLAFLALRRQLQDLIDCANAWCKGDGERLARAQALLAPHLAPPAATAATAAPPSGGSSGSGGMSVTIQLANGQMATINVQSAEQIAATAAALQSAGMLPPSSFIGTPPQPVPAMVTPAALAAPTAAASAATTCGTSPGPAAAAAAAAGDAPTEPQPPPLAPQQQQPIMFLGSPPGSLVLPGSGCGATAATICLVNPATGQQQVVGFAPLLASGDGADTAAAAAAATLLPGVWGGTGTGTGMWASIPEALVQRRWLQLPGGAAGSGMLAAALASPDPSPQGAVGPLEGGLAGVRARSMPGSVARVGSVTTGGGGGGAPRGMCSIEGCSADLSQLREYHQRFRICDYHLKVPSIMRDGVLQRFCQQCGRFHHLSEFDGTKRSCRTRLDRHNARRRKRGNEGAEGGGGGSATLPGSGAEGLVSADGNSGSNNHNNRAAGSYAPGGVAGKNNNTQGGGSASPRSRTASPTPKDDGDASPLTRQQQESPLQSPSPRKQPRPSLAQCSPAGMRSEGGPGPVATSSLGGPVPVDEPLIPTTLTFTALPHDAGCEPPPLHCCGSSGSNRSMLSAGTSQRPASASEAMLLLVAGGGGGGSHNGGGAAAAPPAGPDFARGSLPSSTTSTSEEPSHVHQTPRHADEGLKPSLAMFMLSSHAPGAAAGIHGRGSGGCSSSSGPPALASGLAMLAQAATKWVELDAGGVCT